MLPEKPVFKINGKSGEQIDSVTVGTQQCQSQNGANLLKFSHLKRVKVSSSDVGVLLVFLGLVNYINS